MNLNHQICLSLVIINSLIIIFISYRCPVTSFLPLLRFWLPDRSVCFQQLKLPTWCTRYTRTAQIDAAS